MTIIREPHGPELRPLHARASEAGGRAFADALCDVVDDARFRLRMRERGAYPPMQAKVEREAAQRIHDAANALWAALWAREGDPDEDGRQRWRPASEHLFTGHKALFSRLDHDLEQLLDLAEQHLGELPRAGKPPDYLRRAILAKLRAVFVDHHVEFTATARQVYEDGTLYTSLAVDAVMIVFPDLDAEAARKAIRDHLRRFGTDSAAD